MEIHCRVTLIAQQSCGAPLIESMLVIDLFGVFPNATLA